MVTPFCGRKLSRLCYFVIIKTFAFTCDGSKDYACDEKLLDKKLRYVSLQKFPTTKALCWTVNILKFSKVT